MRKLLVKSVAISALAASYATASAYTYTYVDLGTTNPPTAISNGYIVGNLTAGGGYYRTFSGTTVNTTNAISGTTEARDVNNSGQVTGYYTAPMVVHAYRYSTGSSTMLYLDQSDTIPMDPVLGYGINANGWITGWDDHLNHAFIWDCASATTNLIDYPAPFSPSGTAAWGNAINDNKDVAGFARFGTSPKGVDAAAVRIYNAGWTNLGVGGQATGISNNQVACGNTTNSGVNNGFRWTAGGGVTYPISTSLQSSANDINQSDWSVGAYRASGGAQYTTAYIYDGTSVHDMSSMINAGITWGSFPSTPGIVAILSCTAIDDNGDVVGTSYKFNGFGPFAQYETHYFYAYRTS